MRMSLKASGNATLLLACLVSFPTWGAEVAGRVKTLRGNVTITRDHTAMIATPGSILLAGDQLKTGKDSALGVTLKDDTSLSMGANSGVVLEKFHFDSTTHEGNLFLSMTKGAMGFVTGLIGKLAPQKVAIKLPASTIGIRGTEFIVEVEGGSHD
jgi:FecR protein